MNLKLLETAEMCARIGYILQLLPDERSTLECVEGFVTSFASSEALSIILPIIWDRVVRTNQESFIF